MSQASPDPCGSGSHPGGGVNGQPGRLAAQAVLGS
jgi:hypothetical protein